VRTRRTATTPGGGEPRFPGYDALAQRNTWDAVTARVVLRRLHPSERASFFSSDEEPIARALLDHLLAQDDEPKVPVFEAVDERLASRRGDGFRYDDLPEDPETWRCSVWALEAAAREKSGRGFAELERDQQRDLIEDVRLSDGTWQGLPAAHLFKVWIRYACAAFYSHPWTWNEIGFGGPAYPRGYKHLALGGREPWEVHERDAHDPIPWAERAEAAKKRHAEGLSSSPPGSAGREE
jgi:Gluconate 2-dehydrogenase subunit 3